MSETMRLEIPYILPSINEQLRMHFRGRHRIKMRCMEYLMVAKVEWRKENHHLMPKALLTFRLKLERHGGRKLDADNLVATHKPLIDAMKERDGLGLIHDDSPKHMLSCVVTQHPGKRRHTVIILEPA